MKSILGLFVLFVLFVLLAGTGLAQVDVVPKSGSYVLTAARHVVQIDGDIRELEPDPEPIHVEIHASADALGICMNGELFLTLYSSGEPDSYTGEDDQLGSQVTYAVLDATSGELSFVDPDLSLRAGIGLVYSVKLEQEKASEPCW